MIIVKSKVLFAFGDVDRKFNLFSIRKSLLSALIGIYEAEQKIDLEKTLRELEIDDRLGLSTRERLASLHDLLTARSGVYHPSGYETEWMEAIKPKRGSVGPGTTWCYNNWDFNTIGTIFRSVTGDDIHEEFYKRIAVPLEMEDFLPGLDGALITMDASIHPVYTFSMTARDLARFGDLYLQMGRSKLKQVIPREWVRRSLLPYSDAGPLGSYGYMWWVSRSGILYPQVVVPEGTYAAKGAFGHHLVMVPQRDLVVVHLIDSDKTPEGVTASDFGRLLKLIVDASCGCR